MRVAAACGIVVGLIYAWSPLLVLSMLGYALLARAAMTIPDPAERRWVVALLAAALAARLAVIAALVVSTDHATTPFGWLFGDEEYFVRRAIWLHNLALGVPISLADIRYAYDESISARFVWLLATVKLLVGPAPYGLRMLSVLVYLAGAFVLYRAVRPVFGRPASLAGFALLLFLPSLFAWSIAILKEPVFAAVSAALAGLAIAARRWSWTARCAAAGLMATAVVAAEAVREGGAVVAGVGAAAGLILAALAARRRVVLASVATAALVMPLVFADGRTRDELTEAASLAARRHWDQVHARGHSYTLLEPAFYRDEPSAARMTAGDLIRFTLGGFAAYVTVPTPWEMQSPAELAHLPEQVLWYGLVLLWPIGVVEAFRRDSYVPAILMGHVLVSVTIVALTGGNVGTLVRHRALALPFIVWFSALGWVVVVGWLAGARNGSVGREAEA